MRVLATLSLLASAAVGVLAADELNIDVTYAVECERKTKSGDTVHVRGPPLGSIKQAIRLRPFSCCLPLALQPKIWGEPPKSRMVPNRALSQPLTPGVWGCLPLLLL